MPRSLGPRKPRWGSPTGSAGGGPATSTRRSLPGVSWSTAISSPKARRVRGPTPLRPLVPSLATDIGPNLLPMSSPNVCSSKRRARHGGARPPVFRAHVHEQSVARAVSSARPLGLSGVPPPVCSHNAGVCARICLFPCCADRVSLVFFADDCSQALQRARQERSCQLTTKESRLPRPRTTGVGGAPLVRPPRVSGQRGDSVIQPMPAFGERSRARPHGMRSMRLEAALSSLLWRLTVPTVRVCLRTGEVAVASSMVRLYLRPPVLIRRGPFQEPLRRRPDAHTLNNSRVFLLRGHEVKQIQCRATQRHCSDCIATLLVWHPLV